MSLHPDHGREVAADLRSAGLATLLFDLLTEPESASRADVPPEK